MKGHTLLEIMIVMAIFIVIVGVAVPAYTRIRQAARIAEAQTRVELLASAVKQLAWDTGRWPGALLRNVPQNPELWDLSVAKAGLLATDGKFPNWAGPYIGDVPIDPWGSPYFFDPDYTIGGRVRVAVGSFGPNRRGKNVYDSDNILVFLDD